MKTQAIFNCFVGARGAAAGGYAVSIGRDCLVGREDLWDSGAAAGGFQSGFRLGSESFPRCGHVREFTYNYVNIHPEHPAPHDLLSSGGNEVCFATTPPDMEASCKASQQSGYATRYSFSAKEKDDETQYSYFGARYYDSDLSVWLSVDPLSDKFPNISPYNYCGNNPVVYFDPNGKYQIPTDKLEEYRKEYPETMNYIENQLKTDVMGCQKMLDAYMEISNNTFTADRVEEAVTMGTGPNFAIVENPGGYVWSTEAHGHYDDYSNTIEINKVDVAKAEKVLQSKASVEDKRVAFMGVFKTILHETAEYGNTNQSSNTVPKAKHVPGIEPGYMFENKVWGSGVYNAPASNMYDPYTARNVIRQQIRFDEENTLPTLE